MSPPSRPPGARHVVRVRRRFDVPVERVLNAWSDPTALAQWAWGSLGRSARAEVDFRVGGSFRVVTERPNGEIWRMSGKYTAIDPNRRVAHTLVWDAPMGYPPVQEHIAADFEADGSGATVEMVHTGVPDAKAAAAHERGWEDVLTALAAFLESD